MRGEYDVIEQTGTTVVGSPPHARGILADELGMSEITGITPACAGNTNQKKSLQFVGWDHPRMRGEY